MGVNQQRARLKRLNAQGRNAADRKGTSYAPALFAEEPDNQGFGKKQFEDAMRRPSNLKNLVGAPLAARHAIAARTARRVVSETMQDASFGVEFF